MDQPALARLGRAALPIVAVLVFVVVVGASVYAAGDKLGFDFLAYHQAAVRLLNGQPLYDMSFQTTGGFGLFYYPPTFAPLILPFGLLSATAAVWTWTAILIGSFAAGVVVLPVTRTVRWWIVLLAGLSWPFAYAVKLGQVGPILFLLFAIGWRWLDDPIRLGASAALGTAIKLQPGIIFVWAILTRRWAAVAAGAVVLAGLAIAATLIAGTGAWSDFATLVRQVGDPITTEHNFTPGAVAYQLGLSAELASLLQLACTVLVIGAVVAAARLGDRRGLVPRRGHRQPAAVADPVGPLRDAAAAPGRLPLRRRPLVGGGHPAGHRGAADRDHARDRLPARLRGRARGDARGRDPRAPGGRRVTSA